MTNDPLRAFLDVLIRRWYIVLTMPVLAVIAALLVTATIKPMFETTAVIALSPVSLAVPTSNQAPPYYYVVDSSHHLPTAFTPSYYIALLKGADVLEKVKPAATVNITSNSGDKSLIEITARSDDPHRATETANAWAQAGAARIVQVLLPAGDEAKQAQAQLDAAEQALAQFAQANGLGDYNLSKLRGANLATAKQLELARLLRARDTAEAVYLDFARELESETILTESAYKPNVIPAAVPAAPVSPKPAQNLGVGAAFGLLVGILAAFAVEFVTRKR